MACPGGCIGGGGQPYPPKGYTFLDERLFFKRAEALYHIDEAKKCRVSKENQTVKKLYEELVENPGSDIAKKLLHTSYAPKYPRGI